jgi:peptide/nickel transport system permease protein
VFFMMVIFVATRASGDPALLILPIDASQAQIDQTRRQIGTDRTYPEQFAIFLVDMATFDFGRSIVNKEKVTTLLKERIPPSLKLGLASTIIVLLTAFPLGVLAATHRGQLSDHVVRFVAAAGQAAPGFWVGLVLIELFAVRWNLFPVSGIGDGGLASWKHFVLPGITHALLLFAAMTRLLRSSMLETLDAEFVKLARAKGVRESRVVWVHVFRNAMLPIMTFMAIWTGTAIAGSVVTETVFEWPGVGRMFIVAISARDFPVIQAVVALVVVGVLLANLIVDLLYAVVDPRIAVAGVRR